MSQIIDAYNASKQAGGKQTLAEFQKTFTPTAPAPVAAGAPPAQNTPVQPNTVAPTGFTRDKNLEAATIKKLGLSNIQAMQLADNPAFQKQFLDMAYGANASQLPEYQKLTAADQERQGLGDQMGKIRQNAPNAMLALEDALRTKKDVGNQALGQSDLFKKAGLDGFFNLNQSLADNSRMMQERYGSFINALSRVGQYQSNQYRGLADQYKTLTDTYNQKQQEMNQVLEQVQKHQEAMDLADQEFNLWQQQQDYLRSLAPSAEDILDARTKGYEYVDGEYVPADSFQAIFGTVGNPSDKLFDQCGYFSNRATNAAELGKRVGDSWESKIKTADTVVRKGSGILDPESFNFQSGNTLYVPIGKYGHTAVITNYDPATGNIEVIERNKNLDGKTTSGLYNVMDLQKQYGEWGVANTSWNPEVKRKMQTGGADSEEYGIAESILDPMSDAKLSDLTPTVKAKLLPIINQLKNKIMQENPGAEGVMLASAGGSNPNPTFIQSMEKAGTVVNQLGALQEAMNKKSVMDQSEAKEGKLDLSPLTGWLKKKNPWDTDAAEVTAILQATVPNLARGIYGEVGVLTNSDIENYIKTLPNLRSTEDIRNLVMAATLKTVKNSIENKITYNANSGNDMSRWVPAYRKLNEEIAAIEGKIGIGGAKQNSSNLIKIQSKEGKYYLMSPEDAKIAVSEGGKIIQ